VRARKRFAQHFLEKAWVAKLVTAIDLRPDDAVVEIGPGRGALTRPLAEHARRVLAIEIDRDLAAALDRDRPDNVSVVCGDVLDVDLASVVEAWLGSRLDAAHSVRVVGNLPYNISSPILFRLLDLAASTGGIVDATLMLQKEVADRLLARVDTSEYGVLAILTSLRADVTRLLALPPGAFRPAPRVHSAVIRLSFRPPRVPISDEGLLVRMVRSMFTQRRKTLQNALKAFAGRGPIGATAALASAGIDGRRRPETLSLLEVAALARAFERPGS
jgi:16S rRNA (adenine1518-N6/adenine1519-N6)-dimethyltransferase